jgi:hypothetical protein
MTDPATIFREEALRNREAQPPPAQTPRPTPRWIARAYWALLVLVAVGLAASALIRVGEAAGGPAVIRDGAVEAAVPAVFAANLHQGMPVDLTLRGRGTVIVALTSTGPEVADAAAASKTLGITISGVGPAPGALLVIRAAAPQHAVEGATGTVSVRVGSRPLIVSLVTGLISSATDD